MKAHAWRDVGWTVTEGEVKQMKANVRRRRVRVVEGVGAGDRAEGEEGEG